MSCTDLTPRAIFVTVFALVGDLASGTTVENAVISSVGSPTLLCILGSRVFFNLKEAAEHGVNPGTNWSSYSHSDIRFRKMQDADNV